jgi:dTMP kinase
VAWVPDLTLLLDAPAEVGRGRAFERGEADRLDSEEAVFYENVRQAYLELARAEPDRFAVVDAGQELAQVQAAIAIEIQRLLSDSLD